MKYRFFALLSACILALVVVLIARAQDAAEPILYDFDPANFANPTKVDNQWFPLQPGTQYIYDGVTVEDDGTSVPHRVIITVTDLTKVIGDVRTVVTWDQDYSDGELAEAELAFYAQDNEGGVWRVGEYPEEYDGGKVIASPTWIHGIDEARAGIMMLAQPKLDVPAYREGWGPAVDWTDFGRVDQVGQEICVPLTCFKDVLVIAESSDSEPDAYQLKFYAPRVGNIRVGWRGAGEKTQETLELTELTALSPTALEEVRVAALRLEQSAYLTSAAVYGMTSPLEYPPGTPLEAPAVVTSEAKGGHWEGTVSRAEGDQIVFDVTPRSEADNIEVELVVDGLACVAEIELTPINPDGKFTLVAEADTNAIEGSFDSSTTASGTVTIHDCGGSPVPPVSGQESYKWSAEWVSEEVG
jgi:hypothetical protein